MSDQSEELLREILKSTNRTTRAVRAFVRFLFIQLSAITMAVLVFNLGDLLQNPSECAYGICPPSPGFTLFAGLIWVVGVVWASYAGWNELELSDPARKERVATAERPLASQSNNGVFGGYSEAGTCKSCGAPMADSESYCSACGASKTIG